MKQKVISMKSRPYCRSIFLRTAVSKYKSTGSGSRNQMRLGSQRRLYTPIGRPKVDALKLSSSSLKTLSHKKDQRGGFRLQIQ